MGKGPSQVTVQENVRMPSSKMSQNFGYEKSSNANSEINKVNVDDNKRRNQNEDEQRSELASSNGLQNEGEEKNFLSKQENNSKRKEVTQNVIRVTAKSPSLTITKNQVDDNGANEDTDLETYDIQLNPRKFSNGEQKEDNFSKR